MPAQSEILQPGPVMSPRIHRSIAIALALAASAQPLVAQSSAQGVATKSATTLETRVGPANGALLVVGGGALGPEIIGQFVELAGGPDASIVIVPTAGGDSTYGADCRCADLLRRAGARHVTVLHSYDRAVAESEEFVRPLREASGVWFVGGRQWRLADAYLGTRTERELHALLARGGVIGGTSAGASIQASYLVRGAPEGNTIMMSPGHEEGFAFLRDVAVDQHVLARKRLADLPRVLAAHPELLGIGIDEGTAILVRGDEFEVVGRSKVFVYGGHDVPDEGAPYISLKAGDRYDLAARRVIARVP